MGLQHTRSANSESETRLQYPAPLSTPELEHVAEALLTWFKEHARTFVWRTSKDPFLVLTAEILLRKTGARAVEQFLPTFLDAYPTVRALSSASETELTAALAPLGLGQQRAKQFHELARELTKTFGGEIPAELSDLLRLPGVGPYTAAMVASTCFGKPVPAVDTNIARVVSRVFGLIPSHAEPRKSTNIWDLTGLLVRAREDAVPDTTWAILDFAAAICTARRPKCLSCPLQEHCVWARTRIPPP